MNGINSSKAYVAGVAVAAVASLLSVWTTIVRDDGSGIGYFMVILAVPVSGFAASFRAAGMARGLVGAAAMQAVLGAAAATAPVVANTPDGSIRALVFNGVFTTLWLLSAGLFRAASNGGVSRGDNGKVPDPA